MIVRQQLIPVLDLHLAVGDKPDLKQLLCPQNRVIIKLVYLSETNTEVVLRGISD
jgi:hypothetical protein